MKPIVRHLKDNQEWFSGMLRTTTQYPCTKYSIGGYIYEDRHEHFYENLWRVYTVASDFNRLEVKFCFEI